jgi:hypothetical protein
VIEEQGRVRLPRAASVRTRRTVLAALTAVLAAGCASAAGQVAGAAAAAGPGHATGAAAEHFVAWSVNSDGPRLQAILTGVVGDYGAAVRPGESAAAGQASELQLKLSRGSFGLSTAKIDAELAKALKDWHYDQATCSVHVSVSAPAPVVAGSGTGAYRGISGSLALTITLEEVDVRQPGCSGQLVNGQPAFLSQLVAIQGTGAVSLGRQS